MINDYYIGMLEEVCYYISKSNNTTTLLFLLALSMTRSEQQWHYGPARKRMSEKIYVISYTDAILLILN